MFAPVYGSYSNIAGKQEEIEMFPSADGVLDIMIPNYLTGVIYGCLERTSGTGCGK